jgi:hypothetical protein
VEQPQTFSAFFQYYLSEHRSAACRRCHYFGTSASIIMAMTLAAFGQFLAMPLCLLIGYGCAWFGHFVFERNKPAAFKYPLWSFFADFWMLGLWLTRRLTAMLDSVATEHD